MALVANTGTVTAATIDANFDDASAQITTNAAAGRKDFDWIVRRVGLAVADDVSLRQTIFTAPDDLEIRTLRLVVVDGAVAATVTASVVSIDETVSPGDYLLNKNIAVSLAAINGTVRTNLDVRLRTDPIRVRLLKGVRYALRLSTVVATVDRAQAALVVRTIRRAQ